MAVEQSTTNRSWWARVKPLVVGAGALAAAALSVLGLYDRFFPPPASHVASITLAEVSKRVKLSDFTTSASSPDGPMRPAFPSAAPNPNGLAPNGASDSAALLLAVAAPPAAAHATPAPTRPAGATSTAAPAAKTATTSTTGTTSTSVRLAWPPSEAFSKSVTSQPTLDAYALPPQMLARMLPPSLLGAEGTPLPADDVAKGLSQSLAKVESTTTGKKKDPLGWAIAVNVDVEGFADQPLLLKWSLDGLDVPVSWASDTVANRLTPKTPHDVGSFEVWVPDLKGQGAYNVNLLLESEVDAVVLTRAKPVAVPKR